MANYAEEPLTKVTLNLFTSDVKLLRQWWPQGWTEIVRKAVRQRVKAELHQEVEDAQ